MREHTRQHYDDAHEALKNLCEHADSYKRERDEARKLAEEYRDLYHPCAKGGWCHPLMRLPWEEE